MKYKEVIETIITQLSDSYSLEEEVDNNKVAIRIKNTNGEVVFGVMKEGEPSEALIEEVYNGLLLTILYASDLRTSFENLELYFKQAFKKIV